MGPAPVGSRRDGGVAQVSPVILAPNVDLSGVLQTSLATQVPQGVPDLPGGEPGVLTRIAGHVVGHLLEHRSLSGSQAPLPHMGQGTTLLVTNREGTLLATLGCRPLVGHPLQCSGVRTRIAVEQQGVEQGSSTATGFVPIGVDSGALRGVTGSGFSHRDLTATVHVIELRGAGDQLTYLAPVVEVVGLSTVTTVVLSSGPSLGTVAASVVGLQAVEQVAQSCRPLVRLD